PRERRTKEPKQVTAGACEPLVAQDREQRAAECRLAKAPWMLDRIGDVELRERRLERRTPALDGLANDGDVLGSRAAAKQRTDLRREQLGGPARSRAFEEADCAVERTELGLVDEQLTLEAAERRGHRCARRAR